jgi:hypothetical protein
MLAVASGGRSMTDLPSVGNVIRDLFLFLGFVRFFFPFVEKIILIFFPFFLDQIILGILTLLGFSFRHLLKFCQRHDLIDRHSC